jgi:hypothetical protein
MDKTNNRKVLRRSPSSLFKISPNGMGSELNNLDPTFYAMQMQNLYVLTHAQMKRQVDTNKFVEAQRPEIDGLMDINTFEFITKIDLPPRTQYLDLIWTYRRKRRPDGSLKK